MDTAIFFGSSTPLDRDQCPPTNENSRLRVLVDMSGRNWESAFHGSVHTATLAVATVLVLFVVVLGSFGNSLVLVTALRRRKLRSNFDLLILNLAATDLLLCVVLAPIFLYLLFTDPPSPRIFCGTFLLITTTCALLSLLTLVSIAIHRQSRVVGRAKRSLTPRQTGFILAAVWIISGAAATGGTLRTMLHWHDSFDSCQVLIHSNDPLSHNLTLFFIGPIVVISFAIIIISYVVIARAVRLQGRTRDGAVPTVYRGLVGSNTLDPLVQSMNGRKDKSQQQKRVVKHCPCCSCHWALEREKKAVTMCLVVTVTIVLCWSPLVVSQFVELATGQSIILLQVKLCGIALVFLNSALDPYIYAQNNGHMKQRYGRFLWNVLRCECNSPRRARFRALRTKVGGRSSWVKIDPPTMALPAADSSSKSVIFGRAVGKRLLQTCLPPRGNLTQQQTFTTNVLLIAATQALLGQRGQCTTVTATTTTTPVTTTTATHPYKKSNPLNIVYDMRALVPKSCCHVDSPDDRSLVESR